MTDLRHQARRVVDQRPEVVHDRLLQLADRLRTELPPIPPGSQAATALGMSGPLEIQVADRGPNRIELRTTRGRIRGEGAVVLAPVDGGRRTDVAIGLAIRPQGFAANMVLNVALRTMPGMEQRVVDGLEANLDDLALELAKPDAEWDPTAWQPVGLPTGP